MKTIGNYASRMEDFDPKSCVVRTVAIQTRTRNRSFEQSQNPIHIGIREELLMRLFLRRILHNTTIPSYQITSHSSFVWRGELRREIASGSQHTKWDYRLLNVDAVTSDHATSPPALLLYNSLSRKKEPIFPSRGDKGIACYCCGPTVYADAHLGHARTYMWFDIFRRVLEWTASSHTIPSPLFVINITDVDDKILAAASENNSRASPLEYAKTCERKFWKDMKRLHCLKPHVVVRVSDHVEHTIVPYIQTLLNNGMAYKIDTTTEGGIFFDVGAFERSKHTYGKLVPNLRAPVEDGTALEKGFKRDSRDFALWKLKKPGESLSWESPWGPGRPGWHIECSAMIESVQQQFPSHCFRLHAGGVDLKFPHHTNEIAQAEAYHQFCSTSSCGEDSRGASGTEWIPHWMHTGQLNIGGLKMSKSLKNFISIDSQLDGNDDWADDFRLWCLALSGSYRDATTYSPDRIRESRNVRTKIVRFLVTAEGWVRERMEQGKTPSAWSPRDVQLFELVNNTKKHCWQSLLDDLDGSAWLTALNYLIEQGNEYIRKDEARYEPVSAALELVRSTLRILGFGRGSYEAGLIGRSEDFSDFKNKRVLDEFTKFRSIVRRAAISDHKEGRTSGNMAVILEACDHLREVTFPSMGFELMDQSLKDEKSVDHWQYRVAKGTAKQEK